MPTPSKSPERKPEFSRPVKPRLLSRARSHDVDETATAEERAALADLLGLIELPKLRLHGTLSASGAEGWRFEGTLGATVVQSCVVTLAPVKTRLDVPLRRWWQPEDAESLPLREIELDPEAEEETDPLTDRIDLGLMATEELALALPDYPRAEGVPEAEASARPPGAEPIEPEERPFAALAALKEKMRGEPE